MDYNAQRGSYAVIGMSRGGYSRREHVRFDSEEEEERRRRSPVQRDIPMDSMDAPKPAPRRRHSEDVATGATTRGRRHKKPARDKSVESHSNELNATYTVPAGADAPVYVAEEERRFSGASTQTFVMTEDRRRLLDNGGTTTPAQVHFDPSSPHNAESARRKKGGKVVDVREKDVAKQRKDLLNEVSAE